MDTYRSTILADLQLRRHRSHRDFFEYQYAGAHGALAEMRQFTDVRDKKMLDLGCGYGGAAAYFARNGLQVTAVDNQLYEDGFLKNTLNFARDKHARISHCLADAHQLPFAAERFDIIRLDSALEHLSNPETAMGECRRVLKTGGLMFINFPLFYSPYGGHIDDYIRMPWFHLLPQRVVRRAIRKRKSKPGIITTGYVEKLFQSLNRMTLGRYRALIRQHNLKEIFYKEVFFLPHDATLFINELKCLHSARDYKKIPAVLSNHRCAGIMVYIFLSILYRLPIRFVQKSDEVIVSGLRSILQK